MAAKTFINRSNDFINVTLLIRQGNNIQKPSIKEEFSLSPGETKNVPYGNNSNIYLNGLTFQWKDKNLQAMMTKTQEVIATGSMPTFDAVLNTNSFITINGVGPMNISGSN
tara:strand:- start:3883 stop:4215 length:333 start_codon:yes stop_codon:yes gene_type:complete